MYRIFVTGATGFLGYHIVRRCVADGHKVLCLRRSSSISPFDRSVESKIEWLNSNDVSWKDVVEAFKPDVLIHAAWGGSSADVRNNHSVQEANLILTKDLISLYHYKQIIAFGSQDEYGNINSVVDESRVPNPISEYAKVKAFVCEMLKDYCLSNGIEWQWIRIFSVFGERQKSDWVIPAVIHKCLAGEKSMDTTLGEQKYAYLYVRDFADAILSVVGSEGKSGIYNLSSRYPISLRSIFETIKELTSSGIVFNYGAFPYRKNQSMLIAGSSEKFIRTFGNFEKTEIKDGLMRTIDYIKDYEQY